MYRVQTTWKVSGMPPFPSSLVPDFKGVSYLGGKTYGAAVDGGVCIADIDCDASALSTMTRGGVTLLETDPVGDPVGQQDVSEGG